MQMSHMHNTRDGFLGFHVNWTRVLRTLQLTSFCTMLKGWQTAVCAYDGCWPANDSCWVQSRVSSQKPNIEKHVPFTLSPGMLTHTLTIEKCLWSLLNRALDNTDTFSHICWHVHQMSTTMCHRCSVLLFYRLYLFRLAGPCSSPYIRVVTFRWEHFWRFPTRLYWAGLTGRGSPVRLALSFLTRRAWRCVFGPVRMTPEVFKNKDVSRAAVLPLVDTTTEVLGPEKNCRRLSCRV